MILEGLEFGVSKRALVGARGVMGCGGSVRGRNARAFAAAGRSRAGSSRLGLDARIPVDHRETLEVQGRYPDRTNQTGAELEVDDASRPGSEVEFQALEGLLARGVAPTGDGERPVEDSASFAPVENVDRRQEPGTGRGAPGFSVAQFQGEDPARLGNLDPAAGGESLGGEGLSGALPVVESSEEQMLADFGQIAVRRAIAQGARMGVLLDGFVPPLIGDVVLRLPTKLRSKWVTR